MLLAPDKRVMKLLAEAIDLGDDKDVSIAISIDIDVVQRQGLWVRKKYSNWQCFNMLFAVNNPQLSLIRIDSP